MSIEINSSLKENPKNKGVFLLYTDIAKFDQVKNKILGKKYELSIAIVGKIRSQKLNLAYRKINKPTDILSFQLAKNLGEIILCPSIIKQKSKIFEESYEKYMIFLVIHGILHLKGMDHGSKMERLEKKYLKIFTSL